jgi:hypothetical protein
MKKGNAAMKYFCEMNPTEMAEALVDGKFTDPHTAQASLRRLLPILKDSLKTVQAGLDNSPESWKAGSDPSRLEYAAGHGRLAKLVAEAEEIAGRDLSGIPVKKEWCSRLVRYARVHGHTPDEQIALDEKKWPGGKMWGYMGWIQDKWVQWRNLKGYKSDTPLSHQDQEDFDRWLADEKG